MSEKQDRSVDLKNGTPIENSEQLGKVIAFARSHSKMNQGDLAEWVGVSRTYLGELERGTEAKRLTRLFSVLDVLGLELVIRRRRPR